MPKSNGRPKDRMRKTPQVDQVKHCACGGKATKFGQCVRCMDNPISQAILQVNGIYLPNRKERRAW
jgi:hypothetical protein